MFACTYLANFNLIDIIMARLMGLYPTTLSAYVFYSLAAHSGLPTIRWIRCSETILRYSKMILCADGLGWVVYFNNCKSGVSHGIKLSCVAHEPFFRMDNLPP